MPDPSHLLDRIRALVVRIGGFAGRAPADDDDLLEVGFIASVEILALINALEEAFGIEFGPFDVLPEHFATLKAIAGLVAAKLEAA